MEKGGRGIIGGELAERRGVIIVVIINIVPYRRPYAACCGTPRLVCTSIMTLDSFSRPLASTLQPHRRSRL